MSYLEAALIVLWGAALLVVAVMYLNDLRLVHNNLTPEAGYSDYMKKGRAYRFDTHFSFSRIDPERLTEAGRVHLRTAVIGERIAVAIMVSGFILFASLF